MEQEVRNQEALIYLPHYAPLSAYMLSNCLKKIERERKKDYFDHQCKFFHSSLKL